MKINYTTGGWVSCLRIMGCLSAAWIATGCAHSNSGNCRPGAVEKNGHCVVADASSNGDAGTGGSDVGGSNSSGSSDTGGWNGTASGTGGLSSSSNSGSPSGSTGSYAGGSGSGTGGVSSASSASSTSSVSSASSTASGASTSSGPSGSTGSGVECGEGEQACGGACVDVLSDAKNCGVCGSVCAPGTPCQQGSCGGVAGIDVLGYEVVDAQYSRPLERIVIASTGPDAVHIVDPIGGTDTEIDLPMLPTSVAVSPDGTKAVTGHDGWVTYIDLQSATIIKTISVSCHVSHIALTAKYAYAIPQVDQWVDFDIVDLTSLSEWQPQGFFGLIWAGSPIRRNQAGDSLYLADVGLSPETMTRYSLVNGVPQEADESPFGMYAPGWDFWPSDDGLRVFASSGIAFKASANPMIDLDYNGSFAKDSWIQWADSSAATDQVAVIPGDPAKDSALHLYDNQFLQFLGSTPLPQFPAGNISVPSHGKYVFFKSDGSKVFVILQADASANALHDFGITVL